MNQIVQLTFAYPNLPPVPILAPSDALRLARCAGPPFDAAELAAAAGMTLAQWLIVIGAPSVFEVLDGMNEIA